jgi:hypothetical protein
MHKPPRTKLITMSTHQEHASSKRSLPTPFVFYDKSGHVLKKIDNSTLDTATSVQITWRIQKNHQYGQKIKFSADTKNPAICPVRGALQMVVRASCLGQPDDMPVTCYRTKKAPLLYITGSRIAILPRKAVKKVQPSTSADNLKKLQPFPPRLGLCAPRRGRHVPILHPKTPPLVGRLV